MTDKLKYVGADYASGPDVGTYIFFDGREWQIFQREKFLTRLELEALMEPYPPVAPCAP